MHMRVCACVCGAVRGGRREGVRGGRVFGIGDSHNHTAVITVVVADSTRYLVQNDENVMETPATPIKIFPLDAFWSVILHLWIDG